MDESFFERIDERTVSLCFDVGALVFFVASMLFGIAMGQLRRCVARYFAFGLLVGMLGPLLCLYWHLYDARTSYFDWLYQKQNPEVYKRLFWIPNVDGRGQWNPRKFWQFVQPYPLYSVRGLGIFALWTLGAAAILGVLAGGLIRKINQKWPLPADTAQSPPVENE